MITETSKPRVVIIDDELNSDSLLERLLLSLARPNEQRQPTAAGEEWAKNRLGQCSRNWQTSISS